MIYLNFGETHRYLHGATGKIVWYQSQPHEDFVSVFVVRCFVPKIYEVNRIEFAERSNIHFLPSLR